ncbi:MAG: 23S rRNA (uracil(1939)-C(5))-methyltransferase RlmD, partial [Clostridia bacterium]|nr:23S rRNA (uracil(1939)-C(5))-methyltransferase RlmD [Clostridia bacterium]
MICRYAKKCGGCQLQNLDYGEQLSFKQAKIIKLLGRYCHIDEIIGMEDPTNYRNKLQTAFTFRNGHIYSGIYQSSTKKIVGIDRCLLEDEYSQKIAKTVLKLLTKFKIKAYDLRTGRGFFRHVLVRRAFKTNEFMVVLVTAKGDFPHKEEFVSELIRQNGKITTVVWNINPTETPLFLGDKSEILFGEGYITDKLLGLSFRISPKSFYQVNPVQTEKLYATAKEYASLSGKERVLDAYCGIGTIGLTMADKAREIIGVEVNSDAVNDAIKNAELNGIKNAGFINEDAGEFMEKCAQNGESIDVVITDPPRAGCSKKFLDSLISLSPNRIVYISCNPETLARDLFVLKKKYKVKKIQPFDMFPFTN